ncbi:MAG: hypothetical protein IKO74_12325 [Selenomonadaceae bacterium]|nr:hypothetical protein [Selenomonadaceae bacterium]
MKKKPTTLFEMATDLTCLLPKDDTSDEPKEREELKEDDDPNVGRHVQVKATVNRHVMSRVLSELALEKELPWHFEQGITYHCISFGDVDSLTFLRVIVKQQRIKYALVSTWVCSSADIDEIRGWIERGYIGRVDFYIGEIFKGSYPAQYSALTALCKEFGGRVAICRNHSKVIVTLGERFDAVVESSANVNHNPRIEQACITVDSELAEWYKEFFDGIISFERNFDDVQPWQPES